MNIDNEIAAIKYRINRAALDKARAEVVKESAEKNYADSLLQLREQFGVDSLEDARAKLVKLQQELQVKMTEVTNILDKFDL